MNFCKPYGDSEKTKVLVIGHDPRLQNSKAEAQYVFFLDYIGKPASMIRSEKRKYDFAISVFNYIRFIGGPLSLKEIYFTNLCNQFLDRPACRGTVFIPDEIADRGIQDIEAVLSNGSFKVILPMAPQVFYHLVRSGFIADANDNLEAYLSKASPKQAAIMREVYEPTGESPFLMVCGNKYRHRHDNIPVIPILHVKQWPLRKRIELHYGPLMKKATKNALECLGLGK